MIDPQVGLTLFNAVTAAAKTVYQIADHTTKLETKQELLRVYDTLIALKSQAADYEDEVRALKEKLRFRSEDFDLRSPFWVEKSHPERLLCAKCLGAQKVSPMSDPFPASAASVYRRCLVCDNTETTGAELNLNLHVDAW